MIVRPQPEKAAATTALLMPHIADKEQLIGTLCSCCDLDDNGSTASVLAELNRAGKIIVADLIRHLASIKDQGVRPIEMAAEHLLRALAQLTPSCDIFFEALSHCQSLGSQGIMYMAVSDAAREYATNSPDNALALIDLLIPRADEDMFLIALKAALLGRCRTDIPTGLESAIKLARHDAPRIQSACIEVLCSLDYARTPLLFADAKQCLKDLYGSPSLDVHGALVFSLPDILKSTADADLEQMFIDLCKNTSPKVSPIAIHTLWRTVFDCQDKIWHQQAIAIVLSRPITSDIDLGWLDFYFSRLLRNQCERYLPQFETWMAQQKTIIDPDHLPHVSSQLPDNHAFLCRCITRWFNSDCRNLHRFAEHVVGRFHDPLNFPDRAPLRLDKAELQNMTPVDVELTICHIIGYCLMHEQPLLSLVFSASHKTAYRKAIDDIIIKYFVTYIFPNYGSGMRDYLKIVKGARDRRLAKRIIDATENEWKAYLDLPVLQGSFLGDDERRKLAEAENKPYADALAEAIKDSIISKIATTVPLKYGHAFITHDQLISAGQSAASRQHEPAVRQGPSLTPSPLRQARVSWVIPSQLQLDPIGTENQMLSLRSIIRPPPTR